MDSRVFDVKASILNCPDKPLKTGYIVARVVDSLFWYYGIYDTADRAAEVAVELGNGVIFGHYAKEGEKK